MFFPTGSSKQFRTCSIYVIYNKKSFQFSPPHIKEKVNILYVIDDNFCFKLVSFLYNLWLHSIKIAKSFKTLFRNVFLWIDKSALLFSHFCTFMHLFIGLLCSIILTLHWKKCLLWVKTLSRLILLHYCVVEDLKHSFKIF